MNWISVAAVQLDVVDGPFRKRFSVQFHVIEDARIAGARVISVVFVDSELDTAFVHLRTEQKNKGKQSHFPL